MSEQNTTATGGDTTPVTEEKTFTQDQVNAIVGERLSKERTKMESDIVSREQQLNQREFLLEARETLQKKGLPDTLLDALNTSSREAFEKSLAILEETRQITRPIPPPYASGTGKHMFGRENQDDAVRGAFGLQK